VRYRLSGPQGIETGEIQRSRGRIEIRTASAAHGLLAAADFPRRYWRRQLSPKLPLTPLGRRLASRRHGVYARVVTTHDVADEGGPLSPGGTWTLRWTIRLKIPPSAESR
jgi:hypothetical protein